MNDANESYERVETVVTSLGRWRQLSPIEGSPALIKKPAFSRECTPETTTNATISLQIPAGELVNPESAVGKSVKPLPPISRQVSKADRVSKVDGDPVDIDAVGAP